MAVAAANELTRESVIVSNLERCGIMAFCLCHESVESLLFKYEFNLGKQMYLSFTTSLMLV